MTGEGKIEDELQAVQEQTMAIPKALDWVRTRRPENSAIAEKLFALTGAGDAFRRVFSSLAANLFSNLLLVIGGSAALFYSIDHSHSLEVKALEFLIILWGYRQAYATDNASKALERVQKATLEDV